MRWFNVYIKKQLDNTGKSIGELANESGYSYNYINELLNGKKRWNEETMLAVCDALGCKLEVVVDDNGEKTAKTV